MTSDGGYYRRSAFQITGGSSAGHPGQLVGRVHPDRRPYGQHADLRGQHHHRAAHRGLGRRPRADHPRQHVARRRGHPPGPTAAQAASSRTTTSTGGSASTPATTRSSADNRIRGRLRDRSWTADRGSAIEIDGFGDRHRGGQRDHRQPVRHRGLRVRCEAADQRQHHPRQHQRGDHRRRRHGPDHRRQHHREERDGHRGPWGTTTPVITGNTLCDNGTDLAVPDGSTLTLDGNTICGVAVSAAP